MRGIRVGMFLVAGLLWASAAFGWSFAVCGDSRDDKYGIFPRILSKVDNSDMEFLIHTGDLERPGGAESWKRFKEKAASFSKPLYVAIGNHELLGGTREEFAAFFGLSSSSYSFTHRNAAFVLLDNAGGTLPDERLAWLDRELGARRKSKGGIAFLVVVMHYPPQTDNIFPHGTVRTYGQQSVKLHKILQRHKVDLVLCSHEHLHLVDDWGGIKVIVSGGAGSPMVPFHRFGFYRVDLEKGKIRETFIRIKR